MVNDDATEKYALTQLNTMHCSTQPTGNFK